ncbi:hypothetical protein [Herminiimonas contaminans]|uniref:Uncharacterized protein n=1 Tax=Herminiimonas contaminans TaxID=1111140 RepID=A0ABS0ES46_9BURK|nr:hypothetical protein [Herminiimonas contaminans]MBF8177669.1 hypothetical protein [Herminiimonas contaminans]
MAKGAKTGGRQPGTPNKATKEFRDTVSSLLSDNAENVALWLEQVANGVGDAKPDPGKALDLMAKLAEFAAPKLGRVEHTGRDGGDLVVEIIRFGENSAS